LAIIKKNLCEGSWAMQLKSLQYHQMLRELGALKTGGGNIRPAGHIRPAKACVFSCELSYLTWIWPAETHNKGRNGPRVKIVARPWLKILFSSFCAFIQIWSTSLHFTIMQPQWLLPQNTNMQLCNILTPILRTIPLGYRTPWFYNFVYSQTYV